MSACISSHGEYDAHETDPDTYVCKWCHEFDETGAVAEIARLRRSPVTGMEHTIEQAARVMARAYFGEPVEHDDMECATEWARALAEAGLLAALPTSGDGCQCIGHTQDAGGGHFERLLEYEPSCPEHSEHVWNPRTGVWEHADRAEGDGRVDR